MPIREAEVIWFNGAFVPWKEAQIHVLSHVVSYGSSVFEGIRAYATPKGPAVFRLEAHVRRLFESARIYAMEIPFTREEIVFRGYAEIGVNPLSCPVEVAIAAFEWEHYLGPEAREQGVDICVSTWARMAPNTLPAMAKAGANYMNAQLIKIEALRRGCAEGIALDPTGFLSEGSSENVFLVRDGVLYTPPLSASILPGITRDTVITLARGMGLPVLEQPLPRELLYIADEVFLTGTAAEITPVRSVDGMLIGDGRRGPMTARLQEAFFALVEGRTEDRYGWLFYVNP
jgi:branched-chain amino acid aminotransferase